MEFNKRLMELRKQKGWSQEQLEERVNVTRQTISKWEIGDTTPEMNKRIELRDLFDFTLDQLLGRNPQKESQQKSSYGGRRYEYKSRKRLFGLPLVHINTGRGLCRAKGIIAIGNVATGIISIGGVSIGIVSIGALSAGIFSLGALSLALLLSLGEMAIGTIASQIAAGGYAKAYIAIGDKTAGVINIDIHNDISTA